MKYKNLINDLWIEAERKKDINKQWQKIYNWLNEDNLGSIVVNENNIFWFEKTCSLARFPNWIYYYLKKWMENKGYIYWYKREGG